MARRPLLPRLLLFAGVLLGLLLAAEWTLAVTDVVGDPATFRFARAQRAIQDDDEGRYVLHPRRVYALAAGYRHAPHHAGRYATSAAWPFRGRVPEPAPEGLPRVVVLGDSCVYGAGVDVHESLPERIAAALETRGLGAESVQVLGLGVPGYSTAQIALLLDEVLASLRPDGIVLYPAAWNDQAPALRAPDAVLLAELADPGAWAWLARRSRLAAALERALERVPRDEVMAGWRAGDPPLGWRVSPDELEANVARMLRACAASAAGRAGPPMPVVVMSAAHPSATRADHPRLARDAERVRHTAREVGATLAASIALTVLDAHARLDATGRDERHHFVDYVHPSPPALATLAEPIADALAAALSGRPRAPAGGLRVTGVAPATACSLGDVELTVTLEGWSSDEPLPVVTVAGAPLLGLRVAGAHAVAGTLIANGAGPATLIVQTGRAVAADRAALTLVPPSIRLEPPRGGRDAELVVASRPGDVASVRLAPALREVPEWTSRGASRLVEDGLRSPWPHLVCGPDGVARVALPRALLSGPRAFAQALVAPAGEGGLPSPVSRWSPVAALRVPER